MSIAQEPSNGQRPGPPPSADRPKTRKRKDDSGRYQKITRSLHREDYERLMRAGWSTRTLERYAAFRYGERISHMAFERYRQKHQIDPPTGYFDKVVAEQAVDVLATREQLIRLQASRIDIDTQTEATMRKLFNSTHKELMVLNDLLSAHKSDLQDLGLFPKAGDKLTITDDREPAEEAPRADTLQDLFAVDEAGARDLAKVIHLAARQQTG